MSQTDRWDPCGRKLPATHWQSTGETDEAPISTWGVIFQTPAHFCSGGTRQGPTTTSQLRKGTQFTVLALQVDQPKGFPQYVYCVLL